ncbi:MAG: hypothetical protein ABEH58_00985 [Haloplanus sp.]
MRARSPPALPTVLALVVVTAGCAGVPAGDPTPTATPPTTDIDFPEGPKDRPDRPATLNASTVREYVRTYEYRYAYNSLWINEYTDVTLDCRIDDITRRADGYEAVVTCTGYSNTDVPANSTHTPGPHADWFTQTYRYRVSERATRRRDVENRDPV